MKDKEQSKAEINLEFKAKRLDNNNWITGFYCKYQFHKGGLFIPCIQVIKEWDEGDYLEYYEIIPETLQYVSLSGKVGDEDIDKAAELHATFKGYDGKPNINIAK